jgi:iron complex outermembrane recepter protein
MRGLRQFPFMLSAAAAALIAMTWTTSAAAQESRGTATASADEILVTGSRITRQDYVAESPISTVDRATLDFGGPQTLDAIINTLPQFAASNANSAASPARQGRNNANLRGLGIQRSLVLLDGRRMTPSDPLGAVDLNVISPALIDNIEIITGGASAVYGSDAIAGVMNILLKRDFEGIELNAQYGQSERGDGESMDLGVTIGGNFDDGRGNAVVALSYYDRGGVFR